MHAKNVYNTVWKIVHQNPNLRTSSLGQPVAVNEPVLIEHCATSHYLASDSIQYRNDFGTEYEVSVYSHATKNKTQSLNLEQVGKLTRDQPTKFQHEQNIWLIVTSQDPSAAEPLKVVSKYSGEEVLADIKAQLKSLGTLGIRSLSRLLKIIDNRGNGQIEVKEI